MSAPWPTSADFANTGSYSKTAEISDDGLYRYRLTRKWGTGPLLPIVMFNPSDADARRDDPTVRKCLGFAVRSHAAHYAGFEVANQYAYRTPKPADLRKAQAAGVDVVGPRNDATLHAMFARASATAPHLVLFAWGNNADPARTVRVLEIARNYRVEFVCISHTKLGYPTHPLMAPYTYNFTDWKAWDQDGVAAVDIRHVLNRLGPVDTRGLPRGQRM